MEFAEYLQTVRTRKGKLAVSTIDLYCRYARRWGDDPVGWTHSYLKQGVPRGTSCGVVSALRHYCECYNVPFDPHDLPLPNSEQYVRRSFALTPDELDEFFLALDESGIEDPVFTVLLLLPRTGLRIAEMCQLPRKALTKEGRKPGIRVVGKGNRVRWVPLTKDANRIIRSYIKEQRPTGDFLFPSPRFAGRSISPDTVRKNLRRLREDLSGSGRFLHPHVFRHTVATRLLENGVALPVVQTLMGHASITTTSRYLHPSVDSLATAMGSL